MIGNNTHKNLNPRKININARKIHNDIYRFRYQNTCHFITMDLSKPTTFKNLHKVNNEFLLL